ncbi:MAG: hypothetical protein IH622_03655 [Ochrobactrum anthropi]|uniref:Uncharacterized protein n=1 Tax=Brucella anthropi TaxID=529 RepID=A0A8I0N352_BRUAN|nr:hypothetical protein [Brucella anthropi]MBE0559915.1 hypothetical protein [Brucella anthropi]
MNTYAIISAALWAVSSFAWLWAAFVKSPVEQAPHGEDGIMIWTDGTDGEPGGMSIGGMLNPSFAKFNSYFAASAKRNAIAAVVSAAASFFAMLALVFP